MNKYYVISSVTNMDNHYAIKMIESSEELRVNSKKFSFDIDESKLLYVGIENEELYHYNKIDFFLSKYKTKINKYVYKLELLSALGRVAYGNETLFLDESISKDIFNKSILLEKERLVKFDNSTELSGVPKDKILKKYESIEDSWLSYWKNSKVRLKAFYEKHPLPQKKNYYRSGLSSLIFGKFNEEAYDSDRGSQYKKFDWLCTKIAVEAEELKIDFSAKCPNDCGEKVFFGIDFEHEKDRMDYIDDDFPHGIYKRLYDVSGACSECGVFSITFDEDEYTCIFRNYFPEIIHYTIKGIIKNSIAYSIEKSLYGDER
jgi:hypothetical protein